MKSVVLLTLFTGANAFFNFFNHGEPQKPPELSYEELFINSECNKYICPATRQCVDKPIDCDCPFPSSQIKCVMPDSKTYYCISKPALVDQDEAQKAYDDPQKAAKVSTKGARDCAWVVEAWKGNV